MKFKKVEWKRNYIMDLLNDEHISFCNTTDNWPETCLYDWSYQIYNWDFRKELSKAKDSKEAKDIFYKIEAEISPYSYDFKAK